MFSKKKPKTDDFQYDISRGFPVVISILNPETNPIVKMDAAICDLQVNSVNRGWNTK